MAGSLGHLAATVSLDIDPFKQSSTALTALIKSTNSALKLQDNSIKSYGNSLNSLKSHYSTLSQQSKNYTAKLKEQEAKYKELSTQTGKTADEQDKLTRRQQNAANQINRTKTSMNMLGAQMQKVNREILLQESGWNKASVRLEKFSKQTGEVGRNLTTIGSNMTTHVTAPIVAGLGYAMKKSIDFQNTMNTNKNLIVTGGESTKEAIRGVANMERDAEKYSNHYGVSQQKIAEGYQELIKRGYTSKQALGAMRSELEASKASGDSFGDVVNVASQTLEAFGMKAKTTAGMTRNTKTAVNELAYAADMTSTDFSTLGIGMSYVGSTAHVAGFSLSETASAMGILSNNGLEADKAGTGLRKVINSLISPTKGGADALQRLNLKTSDFVTKSGKMKSMTAIFGMLNSHMQNMSKPDRMDVFHALFGTTGQQAGAILAANSKELGELNKKVQESARNNYVGKLSEKNLQSAKNQIVIFKESVTNLGMTMANDLLPSIQPVLVDVNKMVQAFSKLDKGTQQNIVKWGLYAAAMGPVIGLTGKMISGISGTAGVLSTVTGGITRWSVAGKAGATTGEKLVSMFSKSAFEANNLASTATTTAAATGELATGMEGATAGATGLAAGLGPVGWTIIGVTAAVTAGAAIWELWGKKAVESRNRTNKWGTDVGAAADKSLSSFKKFNTGATNALNSTSKVSNSTAKNISKDFSGMAKEIETNSKKANKSISETYKDLPSNASKAIRDTLKDEQKSNTERANNAKKYAQTVKTIYSNASSDHRKLTSDEFTMVKNIQDKMQSQEVNSLNITGKHKKAILAAINVDTRNMTQKQQKYLNSMNRDQAASAQRSLLLQISDRQKYWSKRISMERENLKKLKVPQSQYNDTMKKLSSEREKELGKMDNGYMRLAKRAGYTTEQAKEMLNQAGIAFHKYSDDVTQSGSKAQASFEKSGTRIARVTNDMSKDSQKAGNAWNKMVFDPKTGKIKTNAQDVVTKTAKVGTGWRKLFFELKHANLTSNAKSMIGVAAIQSGKWDQLTFKEQKATIKSNAGRTIADSLKASGEWDKMSLEEKEAIVTSEGGKDLADLIFKNNQWNSLTFKDQKALVEDKATKPVMNALKQAGVWNKLNMQQQHAIVTAHGKKEVNDLLVKMGIWNHLTFTQKMLQVKDKATQPIMQMLDKAGIWNHLTMEQQEAIVNAKGLPQVEQLLQKFNIWNNMSFKQQEMFVQDNATLPIMEAMNKYKLWKDMPEEEKNAIINSKGGPELVDTILKYQNWNSLPDSVKNAILKSQGKSDIADMVIKYKLWDDLPEKEKLLLANDTDARIKLNSAGIAINLYNHKPVNIKELEGNNVGLLDRLKTGQKGIINYNGEKVWVKKLDGDNAQVLNTVKTASNKINDYNTNTKVHGKKFPANNVELLNKSQAAQTSLHNFNGVNPIPKILKARDNASGPAHRAKSSVDAFPVGTKIMNLVTNFISRRFKKARGDTDFEGGTAMVNDQPGSTFRELIHLPTGESFVPYGRNVTMALPRHTQIVPATETNRLLGGIPQFKNGTAGYSRVIKQFTDLSPNLLQQGDVVTTNNNNRSDQVTNKQEFHFNIVVNTNSTNGAEIGRQTYDELERQFRQQFNNQSDAFGGGSIA